MSMYFYTSSSIDDNKMTWHSHGSSTQQHIILIIAESTDVHVSTARWLNSQSPEIPNVMRVENKDGARKSAGKPEAVRRVAVCPLFRFFAKVGFWEAFSSYNRRSGFLLVFNDRLLVCVARMLANEIFEWTKKNNNQQATISKSLSQRNTSRWTLLVCFLANLFGIEWARARLIALQEYLAKLCALPNTHVKIATRG